MIDYQKIRELDNKALLNYIENLPQDRFDKLFDTLSFEIDDSRFILSAESSFFFISSLFDIQKVVQSEGLMSWILSFENLDIEFSHINKEHRVALIEKILAKAEFCTNNVSCELGRFIIRCLLLSNAERIAFIEALIAYPLKSENIKNILHFAKLELTHFC